MKTRRRMLKKRKSKVVRHNKVNLNGPTFLCVCVCVFVLLLDKVCENVLRAILWLEELVCVCIIRF